MHDYLSEHRTAIIDERGAVYAEWCAAPEAPTVLIYSHHDVRAAKPEQWDQTAPFDCRHESVSIDVLLAGAATRAGFRGRLK